MKLNVLDRIILKVLLPKEGSLVTAKVVRDLRNSLDFTNDELTAIDFNVTEEGGIRSWRNDVEREYDLNTTEINIIKRTLRKCDKEEKLPIDALHLWEKFIGDDND